MFLRVAKMLIAVHRGGTLLILWSLRNDNDKIKNGTPWF
ncbi:Uncharacterised protein [Segatella copri]|nr:Uncharacterised protein [Segatella copri]